MDYYHERVITELQKAHLHFFEADQRKHDADMAAPSLAKGLMALTEAMIQSELRAQEFMRRAVEAQQQRKG